MIDIHCHLLPGIDDGPRSWEESLDLCRAMIDDGITRAITTPHLIDGVYENTLSVTGPLIAQLQSRLGDAGIPLEVEAAAEIDISSRFVSTDAHDIPSLCGQAVLLEMPVAVVPHAMEHIIFGVRARGMVPVLAHPERNHLVQENPTLVQPWVHAGAMLQLDAESLLGLWGSQAKRCAEQLLLAGIVGAISSDAHSCKRRPPRMTAARLRARELLGPFAEHLTQATPSSLLAGTFAELPTFPDSVAAAKTATKGGFLRRLLRR